MSARVFFHVQHLLGTGHLQRAAILGATLAEAGFGVDVVSGGAPIAGLGIGRATLRQLPPLRTADASFRTLLDDGGRPIDEKWKAARRDALLSLLAGFQPDVVITELFPFGRRLLEFELLPLLEAARAMRPRPLIVASLRDVLVAPTDPAKIARALERARTWYDRILVHGDDRLITLNESFPGVHTLSNIVYTGYVVPPPDTEPQHADGTDEIIVSAGGSAVGARLLETAAAAQRLSHDNGRVWRLLAGPDLPEATRHRLDGLAGPKLIVETARPDFRALLRRCNVSVSQAGYNTVMDIVSTRARAVLVPIAAEGETEQTQRAAAMAEKGWVKVVNETTLTPAILAASVDEAGRLQPIGAGALRLDGAAETVRIIRQSLAERRQIA